VPSFISSFERVPAGAPGKTLVITLACAGLLLGAIEVHLRGLLGLPSVPLSKSLYAANLEKGLGNSDPRTTLLLGASRMRSGFSSRVFDERTDHAPLYYLATSGESPLALLLYVANMTDFSGKLIVSLNAQSLSGNARKDQQYIVDYFENEWNWNKKINYLLDDLISSGLVFRQENYSVANVVNSAWTLRGLPTVPYWRRNGSNGESFYNFSLIRDRSLLKPPCLQPSDTELKDPVWEENLFRLKRAMSRIRDRGGQIALVRFPTSGNRWQNDENRWPRVRFWNRITVVVGPISVHFQDIEAMSRFKLPDASHIGLRDRDAFTQTLLEALVSRGMTWIK
jgi:hypothetical protein